MKFLLLLSTTLVLFFSGCEEKAPYEASGLPKELVIVFYNDDGVHIQYDTDTKASTTLDANQTGGQLFSWHDDANETQKVVLFTADFNRSSDTNVTHEDFHYIGHMHDGEFETHTSSDYNDTNVTKRAELDRLTAFIADYNTTVGKVASTIGTVCNMHIVCDDEHNETMIYALDSAARLHLFHEDNVTKAIKQEGNITLDGATSCSYTTSGFVGTSDGVLVYLTEKIYGVDSHGDEEPHVHSTWKISDILSGFIPTQMAGFGEGDHEDH